MKNRAQFANYFAAWVRFGALQHVWFEKHQFFHNDLTPDKIGFTEDYEEIQVLKTPGAVGMDYPKHWRATLNHLLPLVQDLETFPLACFRLGFVQYGGPLGRHLFNLLRAEFGLTAFSAFPQIQYSYKAGPDKSEDGTWAEAQEKWIGFRKSLVRLGSLRDMDWDLATLDKWRAIRQQSNPSTLVTQITQEYYQLYHLCAAWQKRNTQAMTAAISNLAVLYGARGAHVTAAGLFQHAKILLGQDADFADAQYDQMVQVSRRAFTQLKPAQKQSLDLLDKLKIDNSFHMLWALEDLSYGTIEKNPVSVG